MPERVETVVVGGGQAALALSHYLQALGREHVILERARMGERWRSERWDSLVFQFPRYSMTLPGFGPPAGDRDGFAPRDEVVRFLEDYRARIAAPLREGVTVRAVTPMSGPGRYHVDTDAGAYAADHVVAATGPYQTPATPPAAAGLPAGIAQVHASRYRSPARLPPGGVLVVGSGASGCQIAEDLLDAGRTVHLSVGHHRRFPRRYRGRDLWWWIEQIGVLDQTFEERPEGPPAPNPLVTGARGGHDIDLRDYAAAGVTLLGHLEGVREGRCYFAADAAEEIVRGDQGLVSFAKVAEAWAERAGLGRPAEHERLDRPLPAPRLDTPACLDLRDAGIGAVVWATGYHADYGWVRLPVLDPAGDAVHRRGVSACPGFYFLGLPWLSKLKSSVLCGVGEDAERIASAIAGRRPARRA